MKSLSPRLVPLTIFVAIYAIIFVVFASMSSAFIRPTNIVEILRGMSANGIAALGLTFVIITRQSDMGFPWVASLGAMTMGHFIASGYDVPVAIFMGVLVGLAWGAVNGIAIGLFKLPDMITTIATGSIAFALGYLYSNGDSIYDNFMTSGILRLNDARFLGVRLPIVLLAAFFLVGWFILDRTRFGRAFYATGENRRSARLSGIPVQIYVIVAFCLCSAFASFGAILSSASAGMADVRTGINFLMPAYVSVFLGNAMFGRPSAGATLLGALFTETMIDGFTVLNVPFYYGDAIESVVLVLALLSSKPELRDAFRGLFIPARSMVGGGRL
jgi:simple sugar transport system permease protein/ribose transport system permease protein